MLAMGISVWMKLLKKRITEKRRPEASGLYVLALKICRDQRPRYWRKDLVVKVVGEKNFVEGKLLVGKNVEGSKDPFAFRFCSPSDEKRPSHLERSRPSHKGPR